jgi:hypothetical protein
MKQEIETLAMWLCKEQTNNLSTGLLDYWGRLFNTNHQKIERESRKKVKHKKNNK